MQSVAAPAHHKLVERHIPRQTMALTPPHSPRDTYRRSYKQCKTHRSSRRRVSQLPRRKSYSTIKSRRRKVDGLVAKQPEKPSSMYPPLIAERRREGSSRGTLRLVGLSYGSQKCQNSNRNGPPVGVAEKRFHGKNNDAVVRLSRRAA